MLAHLKRLNLQEGRLGMWSSVQYWLRTCDASTVITQPQSVLKPSFSSTDLHLQADTSISQSQPLVQITFSEPFFTLLCFDVLAFLITAVCWGAEAHTSPDVNDTWNHAACWVVCFYFSKQSDYLFICRCKDKNILSIGFIRFKQCI